MLRAYLDRFDPAFEGLTGDLADDRRSAGQALDVADREGPTGSPRGGYDVAHGTARSSACVPDGTAPFVWTEGTTPADLRGPTSRTILDEQGARTE